MKNNKDIEAKKLGNSVKGPEVEQKVTPFTKDELEMIDTALKKDGHATPFRSAVLRTINSHEELLAAAKAMQAEIRRRVGFTATQWDMAIAKAEGKV